MIESWEKIIDPNFVNAELIGSVGAERTVTIKDIDFAETFNQKNNKKENRQALFFEECKPMILNKTNSKKLKELFSPNEDNPRACLGQRITLYVISCKVGGKATTGIRIKECSDIKCEICGNAIEPTNTHSVSKLIEISKHNFNKTMCLPCMQKAKKEENND